MMISSFSQCRKTLSLVVTALLLAVLPSAGETTVKSTQVATVTVDVRGGERTISPLFFGVCPTFVWENDSAMEDGVIEKQLGGLPCRLLRFPGGTESDVYQWNTGRLHERRWPNQDGPMTMDTDEFIALCQRIKAEPLLCVNTEIAHFADLKTGVKLAADWVRYCNIRKKYGVRYWEIGNEPYYHTRFNAEEYARLFLAYSKAMKAVDPTIKVAAVGHWKMDYPGVKAMIPEDRLKEAQALEFSIESGQSQLKKSLEALKTQTKAKPWWPKVFEIAGSEIDVVSLHWYFKKSELPIMTDVIRRIQARFEQEVPGRGIPVAITEWNLNKVEKDAGIQRALALAEATGRMLDAGVEQTCYWPLRVKGSFGIKTLLDFNTKEPTSNYDVLQFIAQHIGTRRLESFCTDAGLYHFASASADKRTVTLFVVNRTALSRSSVNLKTPGFAAIGAETIHLTATNPRSRRLMKTTTPIKKNNNAWTVAVPAWSLVMTRFTL